MAEESNQDKADCTYTYVQSVPWHHTDLIVRNMSNFLGPTDLCSFRLVCKKWKEESSSIWKYHRTRHILRRYSEMGLESSEGLRDPTVPKVDLEPLTVFSGYRPPEMECNFDCVWAEELRNFFSRAAKDDAKLMNTSFLVIKLKKWNRFGHFSSGEQEGAKWFLNEVADKVVQLTLDKCNVSISQNEFFPTLCRMSRLKHLTIRGTYFQLRPSVPVEPTLAEITPLPNLKAVEIIFENCTEKRMPKYNFPWHVFLGAIPKLILLTFSFSNWSNLDFAIQQFSKMIMVPNSLTGIIFKHHLEPDQEPKIPKTKVMEMVHESLTMLGIGSATIHSLPQYLPPNFPISSYVKLNSLFTLVQNRLIGIKFQDPEDGPAITDLGRAMEVFLGLHIIQNEN